MTAYRYSLPRIAAPPSLIGAHHQRALPQQRLQHRILPHFDAAAVGLRLPERHRIHAHREHREVLVAANHLRLPRAGAELLNELVARNRHRTGAAAALKYLFASDGMASRSPALQLSPPTAHHSPTARSRRQSRTLPPAS